MKRRPTKQDEAYWRSQNYWSEEWTGQLAKEGKNEYDAFPIVNERTIGLATGWIAGIAWAKRQAKNK